MKAMMKVNKNMNSYQHGSHPPPNHFDLRTSWTLRVEAKEHAPLVTTPRIVTPRTPRIPNHSTPTTSSIPSPSTHQASHQATTIHEDKQEVQHRERQSDENYESFLSVSSITLIDPTESLSDLCCLTSQEMSKRSSSTRTMPNKLVGGDEQGNRAVSKEGPANKIAEPSVRSSMSEISTWDDDDIDDDGNSSFLKEGQQWLHHLDNIE